jgi:hypothetical protein
MPWWREAQEALRERLEVADRRMVDEHARQVADGKLVFNLVPGDAVLVREYIPGKMRLKAVGPYRFLRAIKGSGAEVMTAKGKIIRAAMANLKPYHPPITGERMVTTRSVTRAREAAMFDSSSEDEWEEW